MTNSEESQRVDRAAAGVRSPLVELTIVRLKEHLRQPEALFWTLIFPLLMAVGLGLAFRSQPPEAFPIAVIEPDPWSIGDAVNRYENSRPFEVTYHDQETDPRELIATGAALVVIDFPKLDVAPVYWYDNTNPEARSARLRIDDYLQYLRGRQPKFVATHRIVEEPGSRYIDFLIPGLVGLNLMGGSIWGVGFAVVDARRRKLLKRLAASPMARSHYLGSYLMSRLCVLVFEVVFLILIARYLFGVPLRGAVWEFAFVCVASALSFSAIGLLVAARPRTIEAVSGWMNFIMLPMWICSGVFFPPERFPEAVLPLIRALPLTAVIDALRGVMLRGESVFDLGWQWAVIGGWLAVCFPLAVKLFRWK